MIIDTSPRCVVALICFMVRNQLVPSLPPGSVRRLRICSHSHELHKTGHHQMSTMCCDLQGRVLQTWRTYWERSWE